MLISTLKKRYLFDIVIILYKIEKINHEFYFLTNPILNKSEIKTIKGLEKKIMFDG